jgi:hypothetical protein
MFFGIIILNSQLYIVNTEILAQTFNIHVLSKIEGENTQMFSAYLHIILY